HLTDLCEHLSNPRDEALIEEPLAPWESLESPYLTSHRWPTLSGILRELFSSPFRRIEIIPAWLRYRDNVVVRMASTIYDERRFSDLPMLADALEDAGCDNADLLAHLRGLEPHVRGCWALDALLGKN